MNPIAFVTGNTHKAEYLAKYLEYPINAVKLELEEIQSLDLKKIVEYKVRQAYHLVNTPVIVEDVSLEFDALGGLPGPFIKFFVENMSFEQICAMLGDSPRNATARCVYGYFDGMELTLFEGHLKGEIARVPSGDKGFGWDKIFIPEGYQVTRACLNEEDDKKTYSQLRPLAQLKAYLEKKI